MDRCCTVVKGSVGNRLALWPVETTDTGNFYEILRANYSRHTPIEHIYSSMLFHVPLYFIVSPMICINYTPYKAPKSCVSQPHPTSMNSDPRWSGEGNRRPEGKAADDRITSSLEQLFTSQFCSFVEMCTHVASG